MDNHFILGNKRRFLYLKPDIYKVAQGTQGSHNMKIWITVVNELPMVKINPHLHISWPNRGSILPFMWPFWGVNLFLAMEYNTQTIDLPWREVAEKARFHTVCESHIDCLYHKQRHWQRWTGQDSDRLTTEEVKSMDTGFGYERKWVKQQREALERINKVALCVITLQKPERTSVEYHHAP